MEHEGSIAYHSFGPEIKRRVSVDNFFISTLTGRLAELIYLYGPGCIKERSRKFCKAVVCFITSET